MPIIHMDGPNDRIVVEGSKLKVLPFGNCAGGQFDLTSHQGKTVRLHLEQSGQLTLDQTKSHYWQLAEVALPPQSFVVRETGEVDEHGHAITEQIPVPLDLTRLDVYVWTLPEVE